MRTTILTVIAALLIGLSAQAQIELKGLELGATWTGELNSRNEAAILTTLGGIEGYVSGALLSDGRIWCIGFQPTDGTEIQRVYESDVERLKNGLEKKFDIKFKRRSKSSYSKDYIYMANRDGNSFYIMTDHNQYMSPTTKMTFVVINDALQKINNKEEQLKANDDF
jgi:hypothetical protein